LRKGEILEMFAIIYTVIFAIVCAGLIYWIWGEIKKDKNKKKE
jgi:FtsH-binding integral membrane protein